MELTQVQTEVPLLRPPAPRSNLSCFHWLSICSFVLLLVATTVLALLHFQVIPTPGNQAQDDFPYAQVLHIKQILESAPRTQAQHEERVAAHLIGKVKDNQIVWEYTPMNTFKNEDLYLVDNTLRIPQSGLYFVYTQVIYSGKDCKSVKPTELTHTVNRKSGSKLMAILTSTKNVCDVVSDKLWYQPIYQGGIFRLEKGEFLSTETTNLKLLNTNRAQVYFGIIAL